MGAWIPVISVEPGANFAGGDMKPLRLSIEGFTSFRTKQEVSFEKLDLFAISGPTGSGKSSILDAMMYALFGEIPRLGGQGYHEIISHGSPRLSVTFDFKLRARAYRAVRTLRKKGQTQAQLAEIDPVTGEDIEALADNVRAVDARVEELLGLTYAAFAQAVVLPQGEFQRFLKARPAERRELLSKLLRLGRYELVRKAASKRRDDADARATGIERQLSEDYVGIDSDTIDAMTAELAKCDTTIELLRLAAAGTRRRLEEHEWLERRDPLMVGRCTHDVVLVG